MKFGLLPEMSAWSSATSSTVEYICFEYVLFVIFILRLINLTNSLSCFSRYPAIKFHIQGWAESIDPPERSHDGIWNDNMLLLLNLEQNKYFEANK